MDLQLVLRVLWRFRILVITGLVLAFALAFLSMVRVQLTGKPHFAYRTHPQYESLTTVFVTTHGFPWGALNLRAGTTDPNAPRGTVDTGVLRNFASLYIQLAASDPVMRVMAKQGKPVPGTVQAFPILASDSTTLPLIGLSAIATTPDAARKLARAHLRAFETWLETSQEQAGTKPDNRIVLEPVSGPLRAHLVMGRKKTKPVMIFLAMSLLVFGLAFALENLRPRVRPVAELAEQLPDAQTQRPAA